MTVSNALGLYQQFCEEHMGVAWMGPLETNEVLQSRFRAWLQKYRDPYTSTPVTVTIGDPPVGMDSDIPTIQRIVREVGL